MANNLIGELQEHINAMVAIINQVQSTEDGFIQVQLMARSEFYHFNGINPDQLPLETFDYIEAYRFVNQQITGVQPDMQHHLNEANFTITIYQFNPIYFPGQLADQYNDLIDWVRSRWDRILAQRDRTQELLLAGQYATEEQLEQEEDGFNGPIPRRFRFNNPEDAWQMVNAALTLIGQNLDQDVQVPQVPAPEQFTELMDMAIQVLFDCQDMVDLNQGILFVEYREILEQDWNAFQYINLFRERNNLFREHEDIIEDQLELVEKIVNQMPEVLNEVQLQLFQNLRQQFKELRDARDTVKAFLLDEEYASENQLKFGYDGVVPEVLRVEGVNLEHEQ